MFLEDVLNHPTVGTNWPLAPGGIAGVALQVLYNDHYDPSPLATGALDFLKQAVAAVTPRPRPPEVALISMEKPPVWTLASMAGADPRDLGGTLRTAKKESVVATFESKRFEAQMEFPFDDKIGPLVALAHGLGSREGDAAVRDVFGLYLLGWTARAGAGHAFWWWPDEHLEMIGLKNTKENRRNLRRRLQKIEDLVLTVEYETGPPIKAPVVQTVVEAPEKNSTTRQLFLHPSLMGGVTKEDGTPGNYFWPIPLVLLQQRASKAHILAMTLGSMFRAQLHQEGPLVVTPSVKTLGNYLALYPRLDRFDPSTHEKAPREKAPRVARTLKKALEECKDSGCIAEYSLKNGDLDTLSGVLEITPGRQALKILETRSVQRPKWIPATSGDFERWLKNAGYTQAQAAKHLGVTSRNIRKFCTRSSEQPLSAKFRRMLRVFLWGPPK